MIVAPDHLVGTRDEQMTIRGVVIGYTSYKTFETAVNLKQPSKRKLKEFPRVFLGKYRAKYMVR